MAKKQGKKHDHSGTKIRKKIEKPQSNQNKRYQRHFRKFHTKETTRHPSYVYGEDNKNFKIVGITKSAKTNGIDNIPLEKNPDRENEKKAYARLQPMKIKKGVRNKKMPNLKLRSEKDKKTIQAIIDLDK